MLARWHWHIEISSRCTLQCPRCSRQEVPNGLVNTELSLDFFKNTFSPDFIKNNIRKITFCGDDGDPIYSQDLVDVIKYFKQHHPVQFVIITNGSYRKSSWWSELGKVLSEKDHIHFSIDGYDQSSNNQYRVNCDWRSIIDGIKSLRASSEVYMTWAAIAFSFNQDYITNMIEQAKNLGFDQFQLTKSTKFGLIYPSYGDSDSLQPRSEYISSKKRFEREYTNLSGRTAPVILKDNFSHYKKAAEDYTDDVLPLCTIGNKGLFVNSQGHFFPCCWVANRYGHNSEWLERGKGFDLHKHNLNNVLGNDFWTKEFLKFDWLECKTKCDKNKIDVNYATEW